jgi:DNA polymerase-1
MSFNFNERYNKETYEGTLLVDALNICFRWKHTMQWQSYREEFLRMIESIANSYKCNNIIVCADQGSSAYRKAIFPRYKADRKEKFKDQTEEEQERFVEFFNEYEASLQDASEYYQVLRFKSVEADDIIAHIVKHKQQYELKDIWILSSDGDLDLLIQEDVNRFSWRTRKEITLENWNEHYEVSPEQFISFKVLMGDKSDNIPGIPSIGPKRAAGLLSQYDSAFDIYGVLPLESKYKYIQNLNENKDQILTNYELMDLITYCDEAIGEENLQKIRLAMGDIPW